MLNNKPSVASGVLIYNSEGKIFLAKSHKWDGNWIVPGGHLEYGETFEENVVRECKEETNLDVSKIKLIQTQESIFPSNYNKKSILSLLILLLTLRIPTTLS